MARVFSYVLNAAYVTLFVFASPWIVWSALRHGKHREGFAAKLLGFVPQRSDERPCIWLHAVSVGEVNLLATTIAELSRQRPDCEIVVSTTTKTGFDLAKKKYVDRTIFYCPLDFSWAVATAMRRVRPSILVLAELELWPNLIAAAKRHGATAAIVNGRLSDKSFRGYRRIRWFVGRVLRQLDVIAAQNSETAERFIMLGARPDSVHSTGSLKFDGAQTDRSNPRTADLRGVADISEDDIVLLAGSTQEPEEQYALDVFRRLAPKHPRLRLVIVPRHPQRFDEVATLLDRSGIDWQRRSRLTVERPAGRGSTRRPSVLLVDTIGELSAWWGTAAIGLVGGTFGCRGGQNMLEPAAYGVATCFGPNTWNFRDIVAQLIAADGAEVVHDAAEFEAFVERALTDPHWANELGQRARRLVLSQQGATTRTLALLSDLLPDSQHERRARSAA